MILNYKVSGRFFPIADGVTFSREFALCLFINYAYIRNRNAQNRVLKICTQSSKETNFLTQPKLTNLIISQKAINAGSRPA